MTNLPQLPPPPRPDAGLTRVRPRRQRQDSREPIPWLWLGLGVVVTLVGILLAVGLAGVILSREPLNAGVASPTIIRLTAAPTPLPSATGGRPTATQPATLTPPVTPDLLTPPAVVTVGTYAQTANTDGVGVSLRSGASTDHPRLQLVAEGAIVLVIGGPQAGSNFNWWQVRLQDGLEGWLAADFLVPAAAPD